MAEPTELRELTEAEKELRNYYESDFFAFCKYVNPTYMYGEIHEEAARALEDDAVEYFLMLLPRGHLKSHMLACYVVWKITKKPWITMVYLTAGDDLATVQMTAIKQMLDSDEYRLLWPEMFHKKESMRNKWSERAINVDHPERVRRRIRDYTLIIKTVGSSATGLHCDELLLDDIVVPHNAYTEAGRKDVENSVSDFASIKNTGARTKAVGTLYHEKDVWHQFKDAEMPIIDPETGQQTDSAKQWVVMERKVENRGDGLGAYLWPRVKSSHTDDWYGWDFAELTKKKVEYASLGHIARFYAQYYNDTNHSEAALSESFQYYDRKHLSRVGEMWYINDRALSIVAGMDLAWTDETAANGKRADWTAIAIVGVDELAYIYLLDITRFRTSKYSVYYKNISKLYDVWRFRKIYIESDSAGKFIAEEMEKQVRQDEGINTAVMSKPVPRTMSKEERFMMTLEPRYNSGTIKHFRGGLVPELEQELREARPRFDDLKDALEIAVRYSKKPVTGGSSKRGLRRGKGATGTESRIASRFGGRRR